MKTTATEIIKKVIMKEASFLNEPFVEAMAEKITTELNLSGISYFDTNKIGPSEPMIKRYK